MVHSGFEASAVQDAVAHPLKALAVSLRGIATEGAMAPEIPLDRQRPAQYVFSKHVERKMEEIREAKSRKPELCWPRRDNTATAFQSVPDGTSGRICLLCKTNSYRHHSGDNGPRSTAMRARTAIIRRFAGCSGPAADSPAQAQFSPQGILGGVTRPLRQMLGHFGHFPRSYRHRSSSGARAAAPAPDRDAQGARQIPPRPRRTRGVDHGLRGRARLCVLAR